MAVFALAQSQPGEFADLAPAPIAPDPVSFGDSLQASWDDARETRNFGVRRNALQDELLHRHAEIERATGVKLPRSYFLSTAEDPHAIGEDAYEAKVEDLRRKAPQAMAGIETRAQLLGRLDARLGAVRARADVGGAQHPFASFLGGSAGVVSDPVNLTVAAATGGLGAGEALGARLLLQAGANALGEAAQVPGRIADAQLVGPKYTAGEAVGDVAGAAIGAAGLDLLAHGVGHALGAGARALFGRAADPAVRQAAHVLDVGSQEEAIFRGLDGIDHEEGLDALRHGGPMPVVEPAQELGDLFGGSAEKPAQDPMGVPGATAEADYRGRRIVAASFDPRALETDAARFQYKEGADQAGVTARLKGVDAWDPTSSGKVIVFEGADGRRVIADGHQRLGLAKRLEAQGFEPKLDGYLFREADGWTARQVRTISALKNIREGSGTILDAAKIFRDAPEALNDRSLPVTGEFTSQARALARLSPDAFGAVVNGVVPERYGAEIGAMAGDRPDLHPGLVKLMHQAQPASIEEARALVSEAMLDDWVKTQGEDQDMFGGLPPESTTIARARVKAAVAGALRKDAKIYGQLVKHADAIEAGGNVLLRDANEAAAAVNRTALEVLSRLALRSGEVGEAMAGAARQVLDGKRPAEAARGVLQMVRNRLASGEALEGVRAETLAPDPPSPAAIAAVAKADEPKFWKAQAAEAPEDATLGTEHPGLFEDLDAPGGHEEAHALLVQCAPAEGGTE